MESWEGSAYDEIMKIPSSKRMRLIQKKIDLEKARANKRK